MKYQLYIDTSTTQTVVVRLTGDDGTYHEKQATSLTVKSQSLLPTIEALLTETGIAWNDISEIQVATGPGSFTGLRVGASVAATLSWLLSLPINGKAPATIPDLAYGESKWKTLNSPSRPG